MRMIRFVMHIINRYIVNIDRLSMIKPKRKWERRFRTQIEVTFRTRCSNRALVTRFRLRYYSLQIIVLSIKDERKKSRSIKEPEESVAYCLVESNVTRTIKMRKNMIYVEINTELTWIKMQRITHIYCGLSRKSGKENVTRRAWLIV